MLSDAPFEQSPPPEEGEPAYPQLEARLLRDLHPLSVALKPDEHPFPVAYARRYTQLVFNISAYSRLLMDDFLLAGGEIHTRDFESPRQFQSLPEHTIVNATGYGARDLFGDASIIPVRGQTARLVPQPGVDYGITYRGHNLSVVPRRDGILVQAQAPGDFGNARHRAGSPGIGGRGRAPRGAVSTVTARKRRSSDRCDAVDLDVEAPRPRGTLMKMRAGGSIGK